MIYFYWAFDLIVVVGGWLVWVVVCSLFGVGWVALEV